MQNENRVKEHHVFAAALAWLLAILGAYVMGDALAVLTAFGVGALLTLGLSMAATYPGPRGD